MRNLFFIPAASLFALFVGGCTFEHKDYHASRRPEVCYEPPRREVRYYRYDAPRYDRYERSYRDPYDR
jgi:hypothetical protein